MLSIDALPITEVTLLLHRHARTYGLCYVVRVRYQLRELKRNKPQGRCASGHSQPIAGMPFEHRAYSSLRSWPQPRERPTLVGRLFLKPSPECAAYGYGWYYNVSVARDRLQGPHGASLLLVPLARAATGQAPPTASHGYASSSPMKHPRNNHHPSYEPTRTARSRVSTFPSQASHCRANLLLQND